jgi:hypothetical protein
MNADRELLSNNPSRETIHGQVEDDPRRRSERYPLPLHAVRHDTESVDSSGRQIHRLSKMQESDKRAGKPEAS